MVGRVSATAIGEEDMHRLFHPSVMAHA
jgi:hypothetical protein